MFNDNPSSLFIIDQSDHINQTSFLFWVTKAVPNYSISVILVVNVIQITRIIYIYA